MEFNIDLLMFYKTFKIVLKYAWLGLGFWLELGCYGWGEGLGYSWGVMVRVWVRVGVLGLGLRVGLQLGCYG